eukprot:3175692-Pyramimonas_sp.AAC.1
MRRKKRRSGGRSSRRRNELPRGGRRSRTRPQLSVLIQMAPRRTLRTAFGELAYINQKVNVHKHIDVACMRAKTRCVVRYVWFAGVAVQCYFLDSVDQA